MGITLRRLTLSYGSRILLDRVSADLPDSALTALLGRNGTGKSTLLRAIAGLGPSASGSIRLCGRELHGLTQRQRARTVGFVATDKVRIAPERRKEAPSRASAYDRGSGVPRHGLRADLVPGLRTSCARCRVGSHSANPWARRRTSVPRFSRMAWMGVPGRESSGVNSQRRASS